MQSQIEVLLRVARALDELRVAHLVVGSVASSLHGFARATADVDLLADLRDEDVAALVSSLAGDFYVDELAARRAVAARRAFNVIHLDSLFKVDIYVSPDDDFSRSQMSRRRPVALLPDTPQTVCVATPEDTILAKLRWHVRGGASGRQMEDVAGVVKVQGGRLDHEYMREWAKRLGVGGLLEQTLADARGELKDEN